VLGQIEAVDGHPRPLGGPTPRRVFAAVVARRGAAVSVGELIEICRPDGDPPERAQHNVRTYVHRLRGSLGTDGERVETTSTGYTLRLAPGALDIERFEELANLAARLVESGDLAGGIDAIDEAEALWRGRPDAEFADQHPLAT
jgi:DNA-binding SARP family transcriptional activator